MVRHWFRFWSLGMVIWCGSGNRNSLFCWTFFSCWLFLIQLWRLFWFYLIHIQFGWWTNLSAGRSYLLSFSESLFIFLVTFTLTPSPIRIRPARIITTGSCRINLDFNRRFLLNQKTLPSWTWWHPTICPSMRSYLLRILQIHQVFLIRQLFRKRQICLWGLGLIL